MAPRTSCSNRLTSVAHAHLTHREVGNAIGVQEQSLPCARDISASVHVIARLATLVPRPRVNLTRFHGVFAPNSHWRAEITPAKRGKRRAADKPLPAAFTVSLPPTAAGVLRSRQPGAASEALMTSYYPPPKSTMPDTRPAASNGYSRSI